jgi:hypothetical protein
MVCYFVKIDIEGALIQTPMQGGLTYMKSDKQMTKYVAELISGLGLRL